VAVRIRLQRKGAKHMAFFRIVTADSRSPRDGRFIEQLGYYDPLKDPPDIKVDTEKVIQWFQKGAQPTETVRSLFSRIGIMQTWHEVRNGRSLEELAHIEDDARKRIEVQAAMQKRTKEEAKTKKAEAPKKEEEPVAAAAEETPEPVVAEPVVAEPETPEESVASEPEPVEAGSEDPAAEPAAEEQAAEVAAEASVEGDAGVKEAKE
jgi:small subunit ribosomal protein S16